MPYKWTMVQNIMRDPFEQNVGMDQKSLTALGGSLAAPSTAYLVRLEPAADRPDALGEGTDVVQGVPAAAAGGQLQPGPDPAKRSSRTVARVTD